MYHLLNSQSSNNHQSVQPDNPAGRFFNCFTMPGKIVSCRYIAIFLLVILFSEGYSQTTYFNKRYELTPFATWDYGKTILQQGDNYIIQGETFGEFGWRTLAIMKVDPIGNVVWIKTIGDTISEHASGYPGSLVVGYDGQYYGAANRRSYTTNWVHDRGLFIKYNTNFDTLWTKEYGESTTPYDTSYIFWNMNKTRDNGFILTGGTYPYDAMNASAYLLKTDSSGNKQWDKTFTNLSGDTQGFSVIQTSDGGYAIGAFQYYHVAPPNLTGDPIVIKTDSLGNQEWVKNLGSHFPDTQAMLALSDDGNILALSAYADSMANSDEAYKRHRIIKMDNSGAIIWDKFYLASQYYMNPLNIRVGNDGSIITTGRSMITFPLWVGWMMKCNSEGDSIWYREYRLLQGEDSDNLFYDAIETSDKGYLACGYVNPVYPDTGTQDVWLVKVDSMGCESASYCWVDIKEPAINKVSDELEIWPNPVNDIFSVRFTINNKQNSKVLLCYTLQGQEIMKRIIPANRTSIAIDCQAWLAGMYIIQLVEDGVVVGRGKVVVK